MGCIGDDLSHLSAALRFSRAVDIRSGRASKRISLPARVRSPP